MAKQVKKKIKKTIIFRFIFLIFAILSVVGFYFIYRIGILPFKYLLLLFLILFLINFILFRLIISKSWQKRMVGSFLCIIFSFMGCVGIFYETVTLDFFKNAFQSREKIENYQMIVIMEV